MEIREERIVSSRRLRASAGRWTERGPAEHEGLQRNRVETHDGRMPGASTSLLCGLLCVLGFAVACSEDSAPARAPATTSDAKPPATAPEKPAAGDAPRAASAPAKPRVADTRSQAELIEAGRAVYNGNCIACHGIDPTQDGALGPAVAGASLELLEARIVRAEYPPGYEPKRDSRVMVALPHLEPKLPELAAYLASLD